MTEEDKRMQFLMKEIDVIQNVIKRMASNSFMLKGWTITLVVVSLVLRGDKISALIAIIPWLVFWFLDAYFLRQERLFRELYKWVVENRIKT